MRGLGRVSDHVLGDDPDRPGSPPPVKRRHAATGSSRRATRPAPSAGPVRVLGDAPLRGTTPDDVQVDPQPGLQPPEAHRKGQIRVHRHRDLHDRGVPGDLGVAHRVGPGRPVGVKAADRKSETEPAPAERPLDRQGQRGRSVLGAPVADLTAQARRDPPIRRARRSPWSLRSGRQRALDGLGGSRRAVPAPGAEPAVGAGARLRFGRWRRGAVAVAARPAAAGGTSYPTSCQ